MLNTYFIQKVDMQALRKDDTKSLFDLKDCAGADCVLALEQNYGFVLELVATMAGSEPWPPHSSFKAGFCHLAKNALSEL